MKNHKLLFTTCIACMLFGFTACQDAETASATPTDVTKRFFSAFESSDYVAMKTYCTETCIDTYFHNGDVDGMVWAKLTESGEEKIVDDRIVHVFVTVEMETAKTSALYPETETSFYVELVRNNQDAWLIKGFPTG